MFFGPFEHGVTLRRQVHVDTYGAPVRLDLVPTPAGWAGTALDDVEGLLSDHAHCEKKAATTALNFLQHHGDDPVVALRLARLAEQEANHLRRVLEHMAALGLHLRPDTGNDYARALVVRAHDPVDRCIEIGRAHV